MGGTLDLTWVWHRPHSFRKRMRVVVCSGCAGGPGTASAAAGAAATGCCCCWLGYRAGPRGGTAATAEAGFHQPGAVAVLRGCANAREQQQTIRNTSDLWPRGNIAQRRHCGTCSSLRGEDASRSWWTLQMMKRSPFYTFSLLLTSACRKQGPTDSHQGSWERQGSQKIQLTKPRRNLCMSAW